MISFELKQVINTSVKNINVEGVTYVEVTGTPIVGVVGIPYQNGDERYIGFINDRSLVTSTSLKSSTAIEIDNTFFIACTDFVAENYPPIV